MKKSGSNIKPGGVHPSHYSVAEGKVPPLFIRLCHHCLYINEGLSDVGQCRRCGKHLTYEAFVEDLSDEELADLWMDEELDDTIDFPQKSDLRANVSEQDNQSGPEDESGEEEAISNQASLSQIFGLSVIW